MIFLLMAMAFAVLAAWLIHENESFASALMGFSAGVCFIGGLISVGAS